MTTISPSILSAYFDNISGVLTFTGSSLTSSVDLTKFSLNVAGHGYTLNSNDNVHFNTSTSFSISLSNSETALLASSSNNTFSLATGWDGSGTLAIINAALGQSSIQVTGFNDVGVIIKDTDMLNPFSTVTLTDDTANSANETYTAKVSLTAANGILSFGANSTAILSSSSVSNGVITDSITDNSASALQADLQSLIFTPTPHQLTPGKSLSTTFKLTISSTETAISLQAKANLTSPLLLDSKADVFFQDASSTSHIDVYSASGASLSLISTNLITPSGIAIDSKGDVFVGDSTNNTVTEFSNAGVYIKTITTDLTDLSGITVDNNGNLDISDNNSGNIEQYSINTGIQNWAKPINNDSPAYLLDNMITDNHGNIFVFTYSQLSEYSVTGSLLHTYTDNLTSPTGLAIDNKGNLYVSDAQNGIVEFQNTSLSSTILTNTYAQGATSVCVDSNANVYAAYNDGSIIEYSATGVLLNTLVASSLANAPATAMAVDSNGNLFTLNQTGNVTDYLATAITAASNSYTMPEITVTSTPPPAITGVSYDVGLGQLMLTGSNFSAKSTDYLPWDFTITGQGKTNFTLVYDTSTLVDISLAISGTVIINLSTANQMAINGLLNKVGSKAVDKTVYNLSATAGWDAGAAAIKTAAISVKDLTETPDLSTASASYNSIAGVLQITAATNLVNLGSSNGIVLKDFKLSMGSKALTLSNNDTVSAISSDGSSFSIALSSADEKAANAFFTSDATGNLVVSSGWDAGLGAAIANTEINVYGHITLAGTSNTDYVSTANSNQSITPFVDTATVTDSNTNALDSASILVSSGSLSDNGAGWLTLASSVKGVKGYNIAATDPASLSAELQSLLYSPATPTAAKVVTLNLTVNDNVSYYPFQPSATLTSKYSIATLLGTDKSGNVYLSSHNSITSNLVTYSLQEFSSTGKPLNTYTLKLNPNTINNTYIDAKGDLFVSFSTGKVQAYSNKGVLLETVSNNLLNPQQMVTDSQGNLYVVNSNKGGENPAVVEFSATGVWQNTFTNGYTAITSLAIDSTGNLYVADYNANGASIDQWSHGNVNTVTASLISPQQLAIDSQGSVYIADAGNGGGGFVEKYVNGNLAQTYASDITNPSQIILDSLGNMYVANISNYSNSITVTEFSHSGSLLRTLTTTSNNDQFNMTLDNSGNLFISNGSAVIEKYPALASSLVKNTSTTTLNFVTASKAGSTSYTVSSNALSNPDVILAAKAGDTITLADAKQFLATMITNNQVADSSSLAGWVTGILSTQGANLASHSIAWFQFGGDTYLLEQAGKTGSAYTASDTLVQLVGVNSNEASAEFHGHTLTLV